MKPEYQRIRFLVEPLDALPQSFGVITAYNPEGATASNEQNRAATERLRAALTSAGFQIFGVTGCSPDLHHREPGFGVVTNDRHVIVELGRAWKQDAVFWIEAGIVYLVSCRDPEVVTLGEWTALVCTLASRVNR